VKGVLSWQHVVLHDLGTSKFDFSCFPQENTDDLYALVTVRVSIKEARGVHLPLDPGYLNYVVVEEIILFYHLRVSHRDRSVMVHTLVTQCRTQFERWKKRQTVTNDIDQAN
jgi:hypothetical protein